MEKLKSLVTYLANDRGVRVLALGLLLSFGWWLAYSRIVSGLSPEQLDLWMHNEWFQWVTFIIPVAIGILLVLLAPLFAGPWEVKPREQ